ncbi:MAG TPA: histidine phosphatase family protein [Acidimicrobiales bacterium]|nr:histidine phosphatase family protein [Acidimicrobiales bacterium]
MTRIVLVRHGESQVFVDRLVGGLLTCNGLSDLGRRQAVALRDRLAATHELDPVDALLASTMPRARETAEIVAPAIGGLAVVEDHDLCERHPGEADGMLWDEALAKYGDPDQLDNLHSPMSPGGESWAEFHDRVGGAMRRIASEHEGRTVVVACHGGVVDVALRTLLEVTVEARFELYTHNTSLTEIMHLPERDRWRLVRYNDAAHLAGVS